MDTSKPCYIVSDSCISKPCPPFLSKSIEDYDIHEQVEQQSFTHEDGKKIATKASEVDSKIRTPISILTAPDELKRYSPKLQIRKDIGISENDLGIVIHNFLMDLLKKDYLNGSIQPLMTNAKCWYCNRDGKKELLIMPCGCDDTRKLVHLNCLAECVDNSSTCHCEVCNFVFTVRLKEKLSLWLREKIAFLGIVFVLMCWCILVPLPCFMIFLYKENVLYIVHNAGIGLFPASILYWIAGFVVYLCTVKLLTRWFNKHWIKWRMGLIVLELKSYPGNVF